MLDELRKEIDRIDTGLTTLIAERLAIVEKIGEYKREHNLPIYVPAREQAVLEALAARIENPEHRAGVKVLYGIMMDISKLSEYLTYPKENWEVADCLGGVSVRAVIHNTPNALCRYISPLAAAEVQIASISSTALPGDTLMVDLELIGDVHNSSFIAALSVLSDTSDSFLLL